MDVYFFRPYCYQLASPQPAASCSFPRLLHMDPEMGDHGDWVQHTQDSACPILRPKTGRCLGADLDLLTKVAAPDDRLSYMRGPERLLLGLSFPPLLGHHHHLPTTGVDLRRLSRFLDD